MHKYVKLEEYLHWTQNSLNTLGIWLRSIQNLKRSGLLLIGNQIVNWFYHLNTRQNSPLIWPNTEPNDLVFRWNFNFWIIWHPDKLLPFDHQNSLVFRFLLNIKFWSNTFLYSKSGLKPVQRLHRDFEMVLVKHCTKLCTSLYFFYASYGHHLVFLSWLNPCYDMA